MLNEYAPIGFVLFRSARTTARAFETFLFGARGGSLSTWLVLLALHARASLPQRDLAAFADIQGPTLTHHLNAMEKDGLICRTRSRDDRRMHVVTITKAGQGRFRSLEAKAKIFDEALQKALRKQEMLTLRDLLGRLTEAATGLRIS